MNDIHISSTDQEYWNGVVAEGLNTLRIKQGEIEHFKMLVKDASDKLGIPKKLINKFITAEYKGKFEEMKEEFDSIESLKQQTNVAETA